MLRATEQGCKNQNHAAKCEIGFFGKMMKVMHDQEESTKMIVGLQSHI
jgi:hypothetical protein